MLNVNELFSNDNNLELNTVLPKEYYRTEILLYSALNKLRCAEDIPIQERLVMAEKVSNDMKLSLNKLIIDMVKLNKRVSSTIISANKTAIKKLDSVITELDKLSSGDIKDIKVKSGIPVQHMKVLFNTISALSTMDMVKDIHGRSDKFLTPTMEKAISLFNDIYIKSNKDASKASGYVFVKSNKHTEICEEDVSIGSLGYTSSKVKQYKKQLTTIQGFLSKKVYTEKLKALYQVYADICGKVDKLRKEKDVEKLNELTITLARIYFFYNVINELCVSIMDVPITYLLLLIEAISSDVPMSEDENI